MTNDGPPSTFSVEVGRRLRAVRRARQLSLDDVERASDGRWSASAIGAYERGFRNLSLPRLRELAEFYGVPMSVLLGEAEALDLSGSGRQARVVLDLSALAATEGGGSEAVVRYVQSIILERGDFNGRVLSIRRDDVRALCAIVHADEDELFERLRSWGALVGEPDFDDEDEDDSTAPRTNGAA
jgi:transcriptional regulator with XRE-family HTH domain